MVKDRRRATFPVMPDMAPYDVVAKRYYPYQLAASISHPAIPKTIHVIT
jgi:hypothetical protein